MSGDLWPGVCSWGRGVDTFDLEVVEVGTISSELVRADSVVFAGGLLDVVVGGGDETFCVDEPGRESSSMSLATDIGRSGLCVARDGSRRSAMLGVLVQKIVGRQRGGA